MRLPVETHSDTIAKIGIGNHLQRPLDRKVANLKTLRRSAQDAANLDTREQQIADSLLQTLKDSAELCDLDLRARFLFRFTDRGNQRGFTFLDLPTGQLPTAQRRLDQKDLPVIVGNDNGCGEDMPRRMIHSPFSYAEPT